LVCCAWNLPVLPACQSQKQEHPHARYIIIDGDGCSVNPYLSRFFYFSVIFFNNIHSLFFLSFSSDPFLEKSDLPIMKSAVLFLSIQQDLFHPHFPSGRRHLHPEIGNRRHGIVNQEILIPEGILELTDLLLADTGSLVQRILPSAGKLRNNSKALYPLPTAASPLSA
jgi:hypothetical protein